MGIDKIKNKKNKNKNKRAHELAFRCLYICIKTFLPGKVTLFYCISASSLNNLLFCFLPLLLLLLFLFGAVSAPCSRRGWLTGSTGSRRECWKRKMGWGSWGCGGWFGVRVCQNYIKRRGANERLQCVCVRVHASRASFFKGGGH